MKSAGAENLVPLQFDLKRTQEDPGTRIDGKRVLVEVAMFVAVSIGCRVSICMSVCARVRVAPGCHTS